MPHGYGILLSTPHRSTIVDRGNCLFAAPEKVIKEKSLARNFVQLKHHIKSPTKHDTSKGVHHEEQKKCRNLDPIIRQLLFIVENCFRVSLFTSVAIRQQKCALNYANSPTCAAFLFNFRCRKATWSLI